jgi:N-methylhydantoinase B/oxoprolinase/acetone carboxylase alpha subunit
MLRRGDLIAVVTGGSGGYGLPAHREKAAVARDLREERIDAAAAQAVYGTQVS